MRLRAAIVSAVLFLILLSGCAVRGGLQQEADSGDVQGVWRRINSAEDLNNQDIGGDTALIRASLNGHVPVVRMLLQKGVRLDLVNRRGNTALFIAADRGHTEVVRALVEKGANANIAGEFGATPLMRALANGHFEAARLIMPVTRDVDHLNHKRVTALEGAVVSGNVDIVRELVERGANPLQSNKDGYPLLNFAAFKGYKEIVAVLAARSGAARLRDPNHRTPLHMAALYGDAEIVKTLLNHGAEIDAVDALKVTAVNIAATKGHVGVLQELISAKANLEIRNIHGVTPLYNAAYADQLDTAKMLLEAGASPNVPNSAGSTPLAGAASKGNLPMVQLLLQHGADRELGVPGLKPLEVARKNNRQDIVAVLQRQAVEPAKAPVAPPVTTASPTPSRSPSISSTGTGFRVSQLGHVVTNQHVVADCSDVRISGEIVKVIDSDRTNDLAVLSGLPGPYLRMRSGDDARVGDRVVAVGYPFRGLLGNGVQASSGEISGMSGIGNDSRFLQISAAVNPGNSGGPLLDQSGNVVGVVTGKLNAAKMFASVGVIPESINFAIKTPLLRGFLNQVGIKYESARSDFQLSTADIVDRVRQATVFVECWK